MKKEKKIYQTAMYLRLSNQNLQDDAEESNSIANQETLIRQYLQEHKELSLKYIFKDDGWSGVSFDRPGFQKMMGKVYDNEIDCIIVKDLSRLGRDHTETGKYVSQIFPLLKIRFIAIGDHLDSLNAGIAEDYYIPFKGLVNDSYSRDISTKVRTAKKVKRKTGEYGGGLRPYGYELDPKDRKHFIIDEEAADIVRLIFTWTFDGVGNTETARRLNRLHILPPSEYKRRKCSRNYVPSDAEWNAKQIYRILRNDVYTGTLRLGKYTTPNYKVKKTIVVPEEKQDVFENAHEAIIPREEFDLMQELLTKGGKHGWNKACYSVLHPLSGYVFCGDCGASMNIQTVSLKDRFYQYYVCNANIKDRNTCHPHRIKKELLEEIVLKAINTQLSVLFDAEEFFQEETIEALVQPEIEKIQVQIGRILEEKHKISKYLKGMYRDYKDGLLTLEEYQEMQTDLKKKIRELKRNAAELEMEKNTKVRTETDNLFWIRKYKEKGKLEKLRRRDVVTLIDRIIVRDAKNIKINFRFGDAYKDHLKKQNREEIEAMKQYTA